MSGNDQQAHFDALLGVTGCGKSTELKKRLKEKKRTRTLIWSPKEKHDKYADFYPGSIICRSTADVHSALTAAGAKKPFHIVFIPTLNQKADMALFGMTCKLIMQVGNCTLVVEELHSVTTPNNAPDGWRKLNFMGRGDGINVFGLSQRPASVDKAFMGSLSSIWVGRLPHPPDQKAVAEIMGINRQEVADLIGFQSIKKDMATGKITRK